MKLKTLLTGLSLTAATALVAIPSQAEVTYDGDHSAVAVCRAIIDDDGVAVRKALKGVMRADKRVGTGRTQLFSSINAVKDTIQCNEQDLETFAANVNAYEALEELTGKPAGQVAAR